MRAAQKTPAGDLQERGLRAKHSGTLQCWRGERGLGRDAKHSGTLQCWRGERGLGREENNASEEEGLLPPQKTNYRE